MVVISEICNRVGETEAVINKGETERKGEKWEFNKGDSGKCKVSRILFQ